MTTRRFLSTSAAATEALAERLGAALSGGALVALDGELGAGKTAFVRGLARGVGATDPVASPTFALAHVYAAGPGGRELHHLDAWQVRRGEAFLADGGAEALAGGPDGTAVVAVEWAERVAAWLPAPRLAVRLAHRAPEERLLEFALVFPEGDGTPRQAALRARLAAALAALTPVAGAEEAP